MKVKHWMLERLIAYPLKIPKTKDLGYHEDQECFVLKPPHVGSYIGSGKIWRRFYLDGRSFKPPKSNKSKFARRQKILQQQQELLSRKRKKHETPTVPFKFPDSRYKLIFLRWNRFPHPFVKHKEVNSSTTSRIFSSLKKLLKTNSVEKIVTSLEIGHKLFTDDRFVFYHMFGKTKIGLDAFLSLQLGSRGEIARTKTAQWVRKKFGISVPKSWFEECLKGWHYVEKNYIRELGIKDIYPEITNQAVKMMEKHRLRPVNDKGKQDLIRFSRMLHNYCELNTMDPLWLFDRIENALNSFHTIKIDRTHYLTSMVFWNDTLPNELVRFDRRGFENRTLICDKEKLLK